MSARLPARDHLLGVVLVTAATVSWALTGFFTRVLGTDLFTTLAGRSTTSPAAIWSTRWDGRRRIFKCRSAL